MNYAVVEILPGVHQIDDVNPYSYVVVEDLAKAT